MRTFASFFEHHYCLANANNAWKMQKQKGNQGEKGSEMKEQATTIIVYLHQLFGIFQGLQLPLFEL